MDRHSQRAQHKRGDLRQSRSRDNSHTSSSSSFNHTTQTRFEGLNLNIAAALNAQASSHQDNIPSSVPSLSTNPSSESNSPAFLTCPVPTFPSHGTLLQDWSYLDSCENTDDPLLRFAQQVPTSDPTNLTSPPTGIFTPEEMSTLGIQFDPSFDASIRPSYSWPAVFDINDQYTHQEPTTNMNSYNLTTTSNLPSFQRSYSSSPPQAIFSPEQRELKRQRDLARRESKTRMRRDRSASNSYNNSQNTTPDMLPRTIASNYSSTIVATLPAATSPPFSSPNYMPPLVAQMSTSESPELYGAPFSLISNDYNINNYIVPFSSGTENSLPAYTLPTHGRPHSLSSASEPSSQYYRSATLSSLPSHGHQHQHTTPHLSSHSQLHAHPHQSPQLPHQGANPDTVRVVHSRPKPQCWEHGCAGRQFSTFSNLLRHQREKSGVASKPTCPKCGAEFTRTTARNGHMAHEKCKGRRNS